jgi:hypothetical protein
MKEQQPDSWEVPCLTNEGRILLHRDITVTKEGVGARLSVYPATIVQARYQGVYEGAPWLCLPLHPRLLMEPKWLEWDGDERECEAFWTRGRIQDQLIGRGDNPTAAYDDLVDQACARVGVDRAALTQEPA